MTFDRFRTAVGQAFLARQAERLLASQPVEGATSEDAIDCLKELALHNSSEKVRREAIGQLYIRHPAAPGLSDFLAGRAVADGASVAEQALALIGLTRLEGYSPRAVAALLAVTARWNDRDVPDFSTQCLEMLGAASRRYPVARGVIHNTLTHAAWFMRLYAVHALAKVLDEAENIGPVARIALNDPETHLRRAAVIALSRSEIEQDLVRAALLGCTTDREDPVRVAACRALAIRFADHPDASSAIDGVLQTLVPRLRRPPPWRPSERAAEPIKAIHQIEGGAFISETAKTALLRSAGRYVHWPVRKAALRALLRFKDDPEVMAILSEATTHFDSRNGAEWRRLLML